MSALLEWIEEHHPRAFATLRAPASEEAIAEARLPDAFAVLYRSHDGQEEGPMHTAVFSDAFHWLPIAEGVAARRMSSEVLEDVRRELPEQEPFSPAWFPFAADDLGNYLVVDVDADEVFQHLQDEGRVEPSPAQRSAAFLDSYLERLRSGDLAIDGELGVVGRDRPPPRAAREPEPSPLRKRLAIVGIAVWVLGFVLFVIWLETS